MVIYIYNVYVYNICTMCVMSCVSVKGGALVNVYKDGSVLLTHGGAEVGQGLYTKMIMVCIRVGGWVGVYVHSLISVPCFRSPAVCWVCP